jgi:hypothetical protein
MGDYTLAKPHSHGNAKSEKKKNENFVPTNNDCDNDKFSVSTISNLVGNKEFTLITPSCQKKQIVQVVGYLLLHLPLLLH